MFPRMGLLAAGCATVLLHAVLAGWLGEHLLAPGVPALDDGQAPEPIAVVLRVAQPLREARPDGAQASTPPMAPTPRVASAKLAGASSPRGYMVALPPSAQLTYHVTRGEVALTDPDLMAWVRNGTQYRMLVQHNGGEVESEGTLGDAGIVPRTAMERRRGRAWTATHFDGQGGQITFSASQLRVPLAGGAQDKASFVMQLAGIARADPQQLRAGLGMLVAGDRDAQLFRFRFVAEEEIETGLGTIPAWHLVRPAPQGSYHAQLDIWLAPQHHWYPVQLRSTEANGAITTRTIEKIVIKEN